MPMTEEQARAMKTGDLVREDETGGLWELVARIVPYPDMENELTGYVRLNSDKETLKHFSRDSLERYTPVLPSKRK
jgi:hypothetical protein